MCRNMYFMDSIYRKFFILLIFTIDIAKLGDLNQKSFMKYNKLAYLVQDVHVGLFKVLTVHV